MFHKQTRDGFTLAELLVVMAIIGMLAAFLLPVVGNARNAAKTTVTSSMLSSLEIALGDYCNDYGTYPPEYGGGTMDKCSEALYFYLSGPDIDHPDEQQRAVLRQARTHTKAYFTFKDKHLEDYDGDGWYEVVDSWGNPWIYVRGMFPGKPGSVLVPANNKRPWHHESRYDLFSAGPDGKTGADLSDWITDPDINVYQPTSTASFYGQATNEFEDGTCGDDISNF